MMYNCVIFIVSFGRAFNQITYNLLNKMNCNYNVFIVCSEDDYQLNDYKQIYNDKVIVFSKEEIKNSVDTMDNFNELKSVVFARNFCQKYAEEHKFDYYIVLDDDINDFRIRINENNHLKSYKINYIDNIFDIFLKYLSNTNITALSFGNSGGYIGGVSGKYSNGVGFHLNQVFIIKTSKCIEFMGTGNEDFNTCAYYSKVGNIFIEIYLVATYSPERGTNDGGLSDYYKGNKFYKTNFYSVIVEPSFCKLIYKNNTFKLKRTWDNYMPKIIDENYQKQ